MRWWSPDPQGEKVFTLRGAEHPYRVLVESMNEGAISLSIDGTILYCNSAFARMVGISLDQIMGHDVSEFVPTEDRDALKKLIRQGLRESVRAEMTLLPSSGTCLPTQFSLNPVDLEGKPSIGVIVTDLSERKRKEQAEAAVRMRDEFLAIASHELRTPLSTLVLRLGLLERHAVSRRHGAGSIERDPGQGSDRENAPFGGSSARRFATGQWKTQIGIGARRPGRSGQGSRRAILGGRIERQVRTSFERRERNQEPSWTGSGSTRLSATSFPTRSNTAQESRSMSS